MTDTDDETPVTMTGQHIVVPAWLYDQLKDQLHLYPGVTVNPIEPIDPGTRTDDND